MVSTNDDRRVFASDFVSNALVSGTANMKLEAAWIEFFIRIDQQLFWDLNDRTLFIVDGSSGASMAQHYLPDETTKPGIDIVFLSKEHVDVPWQKILVGVIAHEFAHIISGQTEKHIRAKLSPEIEHEADELAKSWGFTEEIEAKNTAMRLS